MFIDYEVKSVRRLFLNDNADIEQVKRLLEEDPTTFINEGADELELVWNDEYLCEEERIVLTDGSINLYDMTEKEWAQTPLVFPTWKNKAE